jgi:hypothetical protein
VKTPRYALTIVSGDTQAGFRSHSKCNHKSRECLGKDSIRNAGLQLYTLQARCHTCASWNYMLRPPLCTTSSNVSARFNRMILRYRLWKTFLSIIAWFEYVMQKDNLAHFRKRK